MARHPDFPPGTIDDAADTRVRVRELLEDGLHVDVPSDDTDLFETGAIDSLAFVELLLLIKTEFGVEVQVDELDVENFRSVSRITDFIEARRNGESSPTS